MKRRTKIVCTLGPAVDSREAIAELIAAGMNVARINCSHGEWETRRRWIEWVRELSPPISPVAVLVDLQGPKFRIGNIANDLFEVRPAQSVTVGLDGRCDICVQAEIFSALGVGARLLLGDGDVELKVTAKCKTGFVARAVSGGGVKSRQGITLVGKTFAVPALTAKDRADIVESVKADTDFLALSYVRRAEDVKELRDIVHALGADVRICAKIETKDGVRAIDSILDEVDVIMVARGDLGLQMDIEDVPLTQKHLISRAARAGKPVITATQMLESMTRAPRPTRAEATDVANAILDGTDAVMLSGETATGQYPIDAVRTMARIAEKAEGPFDYAGRQEQKDLPTASATEAVAHAAVRLSTGIRARALITTTSSGETARLVSKYRPRMPILAAAWSARTRAYLAVVWGVEAIAVHRPTTTDDVLYHAVEAFKRDQRLKVGDTVVLTAGVPPGTQGNTNLIIVETVR